MKAEKVKKEFESINIVIETKEELADIKLLIAWGEYSLSQVPDRLSMLNNINFADQLFNELSK